MIHRGRLSRFVWLIPPLVAGGLSAAASWRTWINPFVDSSREMNVPARIALGERLYRDVVYHYGPTGPWITALAIKLFGRRFAALEITGFLAAALLFYSLYRLTERAGSSLSASVAVTWAAAVCVGAPNGGSFLFPYSFGALFAMAGAFLSLAACAASLSRAGVAVGSAGLCLALTAKPEIGAAAALVLLAAGLRGRQSRDEKKPLLRVILYGSLASAALFAIAFARISRRDLSPEGPFALFSPPAPWRDVYRIMSGLANPEESLRSVATSLFLDLLIIAAAAAAARLAVRTPRFAEVTWMVAVAAAAFLFGFGAGRLLDDRLPPLLAPLPIIAAGAALAMLRAPLDSAGKARWLLFAFSGAVAVRVLLGVRYGKITTPYTILVFPGLAATAAVLTLDLLAKRLAAGLTARRFLTAVFLGLSFVALARWQRLLHASGQDRLVTSAGALRLRSDRAAAVGETLRFLASRARPGDTLSGFPETGFFNFVTGLRSSLREEQVLPGHLDAAAEERLIRRLEREGPRFILIANRPTPEFGAPIFGRDYAAVVWKEIERHYRLRASFGPAPPEAIVGSPLFFIHVFEKNEAEARQ
jgi:hypothetical protein